MGSISFTEIRQATFLATEGMIIITDT
jgi:hypothetical protein